MSLCDCRAIWQTQQQEMETEAPKTSEFQVPLLPKAFMYK